MITPAYAPTATERVLPRLALDFTTGVLDSRVTVTRALNTATRFNSSGLVEAVNADLPRFDYDPLTLAPKGLLIEEARANLFLQSQDWSNVYWTLLALQAFGSGSVANTTATLDPAGTNTADLLVESTANAAHGFQRNVSGLVTSATYTASFFVKAAGRTKFEILAGAGTGTGSCIFDLVAKTATGTGQIQELSNGWFRCSAQLVPNSGLLQVLYRFYNGAAATYTGDGVSGMYLYGAQLEAGAFATSYIPTTTTSLTRNADQVTMTGTNFSSWFNASEGAFVVEASTPPSGTYAPMVQVDSGTANNRIVIGQTAGGFADYSVVSSGSAQASFQTTTIANSTASIAGVYKTDSFARAVNGEAASTDNLGLVPTVNNLKIGSNLTPVYLNRHMRKIRFYSQRILNAEATAFSKL